MKRLALVLFLAVLCSISNHPLVASPTPTAAAHHRSCYRPHSRFTPDRHSAVCAVRILPSRFRPLMLCVSYTESRWELGVSNGANYGPFQINVAAHPWADPWKLTHSWRYNAWAVRRIAWHPDGRYYDFAPWRPDCGIR